MSDERLHEDELVSAYLDGEATPAEIAEVEASDALLARVKELRAVRDALAEPVVPLSAEQRDDSIDAALGVADAGDAARLEARVLPLQRPQRLLLAMAAAVIVLAAVVGTGLIASRGGEKADTVASTAAPAAEAAAEPADAAPSAGEEPMPEMDIAAADEAMAEKPMAEEAPVEEAMAEEAIAEEAPAEEAMAAAAAEAQAEVTAEAAEAMADELARLAEEEAALAQEAPAATTTTVAAVTTIAAEAAGADGGDDSPNEQVVDLGTQESLESLFEDITASWSAALEDGARADSGACAAAVQEQALELSAVTVRSFVATVGNEDPVTFDARFARRDDGTAVIVYAAPPECEIGVHELPDP